MQSWKLNFMGSGESWTCQLQCWEFQLQSWKKKFQLSFLETEPKNLQNFLEILKSWKKLEINQIRAHFSTLAKFRATFSEPAWVMGTSRPVIKNVLQAFLIFLKVSVEICFEPGGKLKKFSPEKICGLWKFKAYGTWHRPQAIPEVILRDKFF